MATAVEANLDSILDELGHFGQYQRRVLTYVLLACFTCALHRTQFIFTTGAVDYRCVVAECEGDKPAFKTGEWGQWALPLGSRCERYMSSDGGCTAASFNAKNIQTCKSWVYESDHTIVAEFGLACQEWKRTLVGTVHNAGVFAAIAITSIISDTCGRKIAFLITAVSSSVVGVIRAFVKTYLLFTLLEFLDACVGAGVYSTGLVLAMEMIGRKNRVLCGNAMCVVFAIGQSCMAVVAWIVPRRQPLTLLLYAPALSFLLLHFVVEESVRWLLSKGRIKEAAKIVFKVASINKKTLSPASIKMLTVEEEPEPHAVERTKEKPGAFIFMQVLKSKTLVKRLIIVSFWWVTITLIYYGLSINSVALAGNMYVNFVLTSLVEIPGYYASYVTLDRYGRKGSTIAGYFICAVALLLLPAISVAWIVVTLSLIGKMAISMVFSSIEIYTIELFPTYARHSCMGICSMIGRVGSMSAPQTPLLMAIWESLPYLIFGTMSAIAGVLMFLTPETHRMLLPDTVTQAEMFDVDPSAVAEIPVSLTKTGINIK